MTVVWVSQSNSSQRDVVRLIRGALPDATVVASHSDPREDILSVASRAVTEPPNSEVGIGSAYAAWLLDQATEAGASLLVASRGRDALCDLRPAFEARGIRLCCGAMTREALGIARRKDRFASAMEAAGIPVPATRLIGTAADFEAARDELDGMRLCVKPASGIYGRGFWILAQDADPLASLMDRHLEGTERLLRHDTLGHALETTENPEPLVLMEFLPGHERSVDCVCDGGTVVAAASRLKYASYQVVETEGPSIDLARRVAESLGLDGIVNVQTREGADGLPRVLEVNTRASGGVAYSVAAGVDLPGILGLHMTGRPFPPPAPGPVAVRAVEEAIRLGRATSALTQNTVSR